MKDARLVAQIMFDLAQDIAELRTTAERALIDAKNLEEKLKIRDALKKINEAFVIVLT